ncbi:hypothetical protein F4604DRAFT_1936508 [Suillus subluteus]|nr:hypothetical protein F4604DRAFT_1936508 [Suillus subluteus]
MYQGAIPSPVAAVAGPVGVIVIPTAFILGYNLWAANRKLAAASQSLIAAEHNVEEEKRASHAARRTAANAQRHQEESEWAAASAAEAHQRAEGARLAVEHCLFEGVRPKCHPSEEDMIQMKARYHYRPDFFHLTVVGSSGGRKSSFINAVLDLSNNDPITAPTGIVETTDVVTRYTDLHPDSQMTFPVRAL